MRAVYARKQKHIVGRLAHRVEERRVVDIAFALPVQVDQQIVGAGKILEVIHHRAHVFMLDGNLFQKARVELNARCAPAEEHRHRSEEHTSELQSLMRISYAVFCLKKKNKETHHQNIASRTTQTNDKPPLT